ncbi:unnamed protein product [Urochloa humidicola]
MSSATWRGCHGSLAEDVEQWEWRSKSQRPINAIYREDDRVDVSTPSNDLNNFFAFRAQPTLEFVTARAQVSLRVLQCVNRMPTSLSIRFGATLWIAQPHASWRSLPVPEPSGPSPVSSCEPAERHGQPTPAGDLPLPLHVFAMGCLVSLASLRSP